MRGSRTGFTLIEVLAAITVLMIIGSILANVFHQATIAWESGLRSVEMSAEGRFAMDLISADLSQAVVGPSLPCNIPAGPGPTISFYTAVDANQGVRSLRHVQYNGGGNLVRTETPLNADLTLGTQLPSAAVIENVGTVLFSLPPFTALRTDTLPEWVEVQISLSRESDASSKVKTTSYGRDRDPGGGDDLEN